MTEHNRKRIKELTKELKSIDAASKTNTCNFVHFRQEMIQEELDRRQALEHG